MATVCQDGSSNGQWQINPSGMDYSDEELASDEEPASDDDGFFSDMSTSSNCAFDSDEEIVLNAAYEEVFCNNNSNNYVSSETYNVNAFSAAINEENIAMPDTTVATPETANARGRQTSVANEWFVRNKIVLFSIDLEHGGPAAGILQLSCIAFMPDGIELGQFDQYIFPVKNTTISSETTQVHKLTLQSPCIQAAKPLRIVWHDFVEFIEKFLDRGKKRGIFIAWNGKSCDLDWLFKITKDGNVNNLSMPQWCPFFLDPKAVISAYTGCKLNCKHSKLDGYGMESVWCYAMQQLSLPNAHNSLADCRAQMDIVLHKHFHSYLNKKKSIAKFDDIWLAKKRKHSEISSEATRKVPPGWNEDNSIAWDIPVEKQCGNTAGSSKISQPSPAVLDAIASQEHSPLVNLFLFFFPLSLLQKIADASNFYAREEWVVPTGKKNANGVQSPRTYFRTCEITCPEATHRVPLGKKWKNVTPGFICAWIGILLARGAHDVRCPSLYWKGAPYGLSIAWIRNTMSRDSYNQLRRFIHFVDNTNLASCHEPTWDPLQKIRPIIDILGTQMRLAWILGEKISIDESMIKYMGRAVTWVQYMPRKPIKHGIKVFAMCCAVTGYLYAFEVYTGKDNTVDGSAMGVVTRLIQLGGLQNTGTGKILYTDNWYTSLGLMIHLWASFGFLLVGTMVLTKKKARTANDFPFHKLPTMALKELPRGWSRQATQEFDTDNHGKFVAQATVWKD